MERRLDFFNLSIAEALRECLSLASLALDLAFAAIIYEDKEIANETVDAAKFIDRLVETIIFRYGIATKDLDDARDLISTVWIAYMMNQISDQAQRIAEMMIEEKRLIPEVKNALLRGEEAVGLIKIGEGSKLHSLSYSEAVYKLSVGFDVIAIKRDKEWILNPEKSFRFKKGDTVVIRGTREVLEYFKIPLDLEITKIDRELVNRISELKNDCEMSLYLGYSAVLYDSKGLAAGALQFYKKVEDTCRTLELEILKRKGVSEEVINTIDFLNILREISWSGEKLALVVKGRGRIHPVMDMVDDQSKEQFMLVKVDRKSIWTNKTIGELLLDDRMGVRIIAIKRRGRWLFDPDESMKINAGDLLLISGYEMGIESLEEIGGEIKQEE